MLPSKACTSGSVKSFPYFSHFALFAYDMYTKTCVCNNIAVATISTSVAHNLNQRNVSIFYIKSHGVIWNWGVGWTAERESFCPRGSAMKIWTFHKKPVSYDSWSQLNLVSYDSRSHFWRGVIWNRYTESVLRSAGSFFWFSAVFHTADANWCLCFCKAPTQPEKNKKAVENKKIERSRN